MCIIVVYNLRMRNWKMIGKFCIRIGYFVYSINGRKVIRNFTAAPPIMAAKVWYVAGIGWCQWRDRSWNPKLAIQWSEAASNQRLQTLPRDLKRKSFHFIYLCVFECFRLLDCFVNFGTESILLVFFFFFLFISVAFSFHRFLFTEIFVLFFFKSGVLRLD